MSVEIVSDGGDGGVERLLRRKAVVSGGEKRNGNGAAAQGGDLAQDGLVGQAQQKRLVALAPFPDGAEGMEDVLRQEVTGGRCPDIAGTENSQSTSGFQKLWTGGGVDSPIRPAPDLRKSVRGRDDGVGMFARKVCADNDEAGLVGLGIAHGVLSPSNCQMLCRDGNRRKGAK